MNDLDPGDVYDGIPEDDAAEPADADVPHGPLEPEATFDPDLASLFTTSVVARTRGFDSRAVCGLRLPRSVSRNVDPSRFGVTGHYGGPAQGLPGSVDHSRCRARWREWQRFHMDGRGWVDIAYNFGVCQHGIVLAGRGLGVRSAANGSNVGNHGTLACAILVGGSELPTRDSREAFAWVTVECRRAGAASGVWPHSRWTDTACPGGQVRPFLASINGRTLDSQQEDPMAWLSRWPSWSRNAARRWATPNTVPSRTWGSLTIAERFAIQERFESRGTTFAATDEAGEAADVSDYPEPEGFPDEPGGELPGSWLSRLFGR